MTAGGPAIRKSSAVYDRRCSSVRHGVAVAPGIGAGDSVPAGGIDQHRSRAARDALGPDAVRIVPSRLKFLEHFIGDRRFHIQAVEPRIMRPERAEEMQRLDPRPLESFMQVGIPVRPEFHNVQECLKEFSRMFRVSRSTGP